MVASIRPVYIHTLDALHEMVEHYQGQDEYVYDVESMGARRGTPAVNRVVWLSFATEGRADIVPLGHPNGEVLHRGHSFKEAQWDPRNVGKRGTPLKKWVTVQREPAFTPAPPQLRPSQVFPILEPLFFSDQTVIGHNLSFDLSSIAKYYDGKVPPPPYGDTFAAAKLLFTEKQPAGLKPMTLKYFEHDYDKEDVGKCIEKHAFSKVARYALLDAVYTWEFWKELVPVLDKQGLQKIFELEMSLIPAVCEMALEGVPIDETPMTELSVEMSQDIREVLKRIWSEVGKVDLAKPTEVRKLVYETRGHEPFAYTEGSCKHHGPDDPHTPICTPKADKAVLEAYTHDPVVADLMRWRKLTKLYSTYVGEKTEEGFRGGLLQWLANGRVYTSLKPFGAATGRFSCVSGDTELLTSRGAFRFDEYLPEEGDLVPTHRGRWLPVRRKIYKGVQQMYNVVLSNGATVTCTAEHRVLTPTGWSQVGDLTLGDEVCSYERVEEVGHRFGVREAGTRPLPSRPGEADHRGDSPSSEHHLSQRAVRVEGAREARGIEAGTGAAVLTLEDRREEPYAGQEWFPAPQVYRGCGGREGLPSEEGGRDVRLRTSHRDGRGARSQEAPRRGCCSSHQRGQEGQPTGQSRGGDALRAHKAPRMYATVTEINPVGAMGVWDIEVEGDHSYATQGFFHHNSAEPNLQNIPARGEAGAQIRKLFVTPPGHQLLVLDYGQIEYRVLAHLSGDPTLTRAFLEGWDPHQATAALLLGKRLEDVLPEERDRGKAQPLHERVLTPDRGWVAIGDMQVGDLVVSEDGVGTRVMGVYPQGLRDIYRVSFNDGSEVLCDLDHLWKVRTTKGEWKVRTLRELKDDLRLRSGETKWFVPVVAPVSAGARSTSMDPYLLGVILGDGGVTGGSVSISSEDSALLNRVRSIVERDYPGYTLRHNNRCTYNVTSGRVGVHPAPLNTILRELDVWGKTSLEKRVPREFLHAEPSARLELLRGLMDTDGTARPGSGATFNTSSPGLARDVVELVQSLGGIARVSQKKTPHALSYRVNVVLPEQENPFWLERKASSFVPVRKLQRKMVDVSFVGAMPASCIAVEHPSRTYVTSHYVVTHNTANFAQVYGAGARKVAGGMGVSVQEAYKMFEEYERRFPDIISWKKEVVRDARRRTPPCVWTLGGRRRILAPLTWADDGMRSFAERQAVNTMCQGTAADIMKMALIKVQAETPESWKLLLTVHDELMMAIPEDETDEALPLVKELMESVNILSVPLEVDGGVGPTWADAK